MFRKQLSSLRSTYTFMILFGLFMGIIFPFYSWLFFGKSAFNPFYIAGCLTAGFLVGTFCYYVIKQVLKYRLELQWQTLSRIAGAEECLTGLKSGADELGALMQCHDDLIDRVLAMIGNVTAMTGEIVPLYHQLMGASQGMVEGNSEQVAKTGEALQAVEGMQASFGRMLADIGEITRRIEERASISAQMSATTDTIALNIRTYAGSVIETSVSIEEMAASMRESSVNIEALSASTEQTSASVTEISAAIAHVRDYAQRTSECTERVGIQAREGIQAMSATLAAMQEIETSSADSFHAIQRLSQHTSRIGNILDVIRDVVEQTNLLSLNASIISAQAGEQGKAFAVVASEVRDLARRTAASTREIGELVNNIRLETSAVEQAVGKGKDKVSEGVSITARTDEALHRIEESAAEAVEMARKIATATNEQAAGSRLISDEAEKNLDRVKQVTRAILEQEKGAALIVSSLERMRELTGKVTNSVQEQARGNHQYLRSVMEDNEKVKQLQGTSVREKEASEGVAAFVRETWSLVEANAEKAGRIMNDISAVAELTERLDREMAAFKATDRPLAIPVSSNRNNAPPSERQPLPG